MKKIIQKNNNKTERLINSENNYVKKKNKQNWL